jgi:hypothetical protein
MLQENESPIITGSGGLPDQQRGVLDGDAGRLIASAALIGAGALIEPELLGGALLGAGIMYGLPVAGRIIRAVATTAVRLGYSATSSVGGVVDEARHQIEGIVADARSGHQPPKSDS